MKHILYDMGFYFFVIYVDNIGSDSEQSKHCSRGEQRGGWVTNVNQIKYDTRLK